MKMQRVINILAIVLMGCLFAGSSLCSWAYERDPFANYSLSWVNTILLRPLFYLLLGYCVAMVLFFLLNRVSN